MIIPQNLQFNEYSGQISFDVILTKKEEHFKIYVNNEAGNHSRFFTILYPKGTNNDIKVSTQSSEDNRTVSKSPTLIKLNSPSTDYIESCHAFITFTTLQTGIGIHTLSNNQPVNFIKKGNEYTIQKHIAGTETFRIIASTNDGKQEKQVTYRCRPENEQSTIPFITLREPLGDTIVTNQLSLYILANFKSRADEVSVYINNQEGYHNKFISGIATNITLPSGNSLITIETKNSLGRDKKTFFVKRP